VSGLNFKKNSLTSYLSPQFIRLVSSTPFNKRLPILPKLLTLVMLFGVKSSAAKFYAASVRLLSEKDSLPKERVAFYLSVSNCTLNLSRSAFAAFNAAAAAASRALDKISSWLTVSIIAFPASSKPDINPGNSSARELTYSW